jgi:Flp pilus assembly protein TadG
VAVAYQWFKSAGLRADRSGSTAAEFALIAPLLTTLLFGVLEFGIIIYSYSAMQFGANAAARQFAVNVSDEAASLAAARALVPGWARDHITLAMAQSDPGDPNRNIIRVRLEVNAADATPLALLTEAVPWTLTADASVKQELPYVD